MYTIRQAGTRRSPGRLYSGRYAAYVLFIMLMLFKLAFMHYGLQVRNIDMSPVDYVIAVGSLLLLSFWTLWLPPRGRLAALTLLNLLLTGLIYSDLVFYRYFEDFITVPVLLQTGQVGSLGESIRSLIRWQDLFFFIDWLAVVPWTASKVIRKRRRSLAYPEVVTHSRPKRNSALKRFITGFAAFVLGCLLTFAPIKIASNTWAVGLFAGNWWNLSLYNVTGLIGFHGYDVYRYARDHLGMRTALAPEEIDKTKAWLDEKRSKRTVRDEMFGKYKGSNIIVIQVEAFMNFVVDKSVNGQEITPNFNRLMKESMYFSNFYHQTALGRTSDADFVTQSSLLPLPAGSVFTRYPTHEYDTLPAVLKEHGYAANVFHSYESSFWNRHVVYREMNYDRFYSKNDYEQDEMIGWSISDASFFKQSLDKMKDIPQPFLFVPDHAEQPPSLRHAQAGAAARHGIIPGHHVRRLSAIRPLR
ncbi:LTA synthase family protein [Paenibacillus sp. DMB20]|uniref:LTA synthase family protein n=1 Tax=Paenibacillus sp. DMB20 TaxID=1642570 RepID=UPI000AFCFE93|nr:LTA synthase family protein [Paenibacillus sp. DMB20]